jgi:hypothetical protein
VHLLQHLEDVDLVGFHAVAPGAEQ